MTVVLQQSNSLVLLFFLQMCLTVRTPVDIMDRLTNMLKLVTYKEIHSITEKHSMQLNTANPYLLNLLEFMSFAKRYDWQCSSFNSVTIHSSVISIQWLFEMCNHIWAPNKLQLIVINKDACSHSCVNLFISMIQSSRVHWMIAWTCFPRHTAENSSAINSSFRCSEASEPRTGFATSCMHVDIQNTWCDASYT